MTNFTGLSEEERKRIWQKGYDAAVSGISILHCPYVPLTPQHSVWMAGYKSALDEFPIKLDHREV